MDSRKSCYVLVRNYYLYISRLIGISNKNIINNFVSKNSSNVIFTPPLSSDRTSEVTYVSRKMFGILPLFGSKVFWKTFSKTEFQILRLIHVLVRKNEILSVKISSEISTTDNDDFSCEYTSVLNTKHRVPRNL